MTDLAGNSRGTWSLRYETEPEPSLSRVGLVEVLPSTNERLAPGTALKLRFSHALDGEVLRRHLSLTVNGEPGFDAPVNSEDGGKTWMIVPAQPWPAGASVHLTVPADRVFSIGGVLCEGVNATWFVERPAPAPTGAAEQPRLVSYLASGDRVDLLFAEPLPEAAMAEPFGIRAGHRRVDVVVRRMSDRWLRLLPGELLSNGCAYHLMLGPYLEIPVQWTELEALPARPAAARPGTFELREPLHPFGFASVSCPSPGRLLLPAIPGMVTSLRILTDVGQPPESEGVACRGLDGEIVELKRPR